MPRASPFKRLRWLALAIVAAAGLGGCHNAAVRPHAATSFAATYATAVVYVVRRGWHIDIGFSSADMSPPLKSLLPGFGAARYLLFGFGDRHYLLAGRHASSMLAAMWPGAGVMLTTGVSATLADAFGADQVITLHLTPAQTLQIQSFVWSTLGGVKTTPIAGPYVGSLYYPSALRYSALYTCNTWAASALAAGGVPVKTRHVILAGQLWNQVRRLGGPMQSVNRAPAGAAAGAN